MSLPKINIEKINSKFEAYGAFLLRHRALTLLAFVLLLAVSVVGTTTRYSLDENNKLGQKQGEIIMTGVWANHIYFVNEEKIN